MATKVKGRTPSIPKKANQENQPPLKSNSAGTHAPTSAEIHAFLEKNYNIDGCNTIDIVHARRENDEIKREHVFSRQYCQTHHSFRDP
jgi:hypothetical protein